MTETINVADARAMFSSLLVRAENGEDIGISRALKPIAKLTTIGQKPGRTFGQFPELSMPRDKALEPTEKTNSPSGSERGLYPGYAHRVLAAVEPRIHERRNRGPWRIPKTSCRRPPSALTKSPRKCGWASGLKLKLWR